MNRCPCCSQEVVVWADQSDGVTVNFVCSNTGCPAGKGPWDCLPAELADPKRVAVAVITAVLGGDISSSYQLVSDLDSVQLLGVLAVMAGMLESALLLAFDSDREAILCQIQSYALQGER